MTGMCRVVDFHAGDVGYICCQCCGMPLEDDLISREKDGTPNEAYCKWCYADGTYTYSNMDELIDVCVEHMVNDEFSEEQARAYMKDTLPKLDYWKRYEELSLNPSSVETDASVCLHKKREPRRVKPQYYLCIEKGPRIFV